MPRKVLLVEPNYKNKYPPMGLMKIASYYRALGDDVKFFKGDLNTLVLDDTYELVIEKLYANDRVQVVVSKRAQKKTLEEIGSELGVTRERVRQIEAKTKDKFSRYHRQIRVISKISAERNGDTVITPEEIEDYSGDKTQELIYLLKGFSSSNYIYDNQLGVFIVGDDSMQGRIQNILESLHDM